MALLNKLFKKPEPKAVEKPLKTVEAQTPAAQKETKAAAFKAGPVLFSPHLAEKALMGQGIGKYVFIVSPKANKIEVANAVRRAYNVKVTNVHIVNVPEKARRVGKTMGFKSGYKKAVITLAKGQTIEVAK